MTHRSTDVSDVTTDPHHGMTPQMRRRSVLSGTIGAVVEWYEYTVYGTSAALVFGVLFFPSENPALSQIAALASFGVGFVARPLGAFIAGHLGDRIGRKATMLGTFFVMAAATLGFGLLPTYMQIGVSAPILLCVLRLIQGLAVGGEWGGAAIIAVENAPQGRRGFFGSWPQIGPSIGILAGTGAVAIAQWLSGDAFLVWGWRLPFLISIVLAALGLWIRMRAVESPAFLEAQAAAQANAEAQVAPIPHVFKHHRKALLIAMFSRFAESGNYYLFTVFTLSYVSSTLDLPMHYGTTAVMIGSALAVILMPVAGSVSDRIGRKATFLFGAISMMITAWPIFILINTGQLWAIIIGIAIFMAISYPAVYSVLPAFYCEIFPTKVRYTGISIGYQLAAILLAGFTPVIAEALVTWAHGYWPLVAVVIITAAIAAVAVSRAPETKDITLQEVPKL